MRLPPGAIRLAPGCHLQVSGVGPSSLRWGAGISGLGAVSAPSPGVCKQGCSSSFALWG